jgi:hypothetical protein
MRRTHLGGVEGWSRKEVTGGFQVERLVDVETHQGLGQAHHVLGQYAIAQHDQTQGSRADNHIRISKWI